MRKVLPSTNFQQHVGTAQQDVNEFNFGDPGLAKRKGRELKIDHLPRFILTGVIGTVV